LKLALISPINPKISISFALEFSFILTLLSKVEIELTA
jgi:hypothetical protein